MNGDDAAPHNRIHNNIASEITTLAHDGDDQTNINETNYSDQII